MLNPDKREAMTYVGAFWLKEPMSIKDIIEKLGTSSFTVLKESLDYEITLLGKRVVVHDSWDNKDGVPLKVKVFCEDPKMEEELFTKMLTFSK